MRSSDRPSLGDPATYDLSAGHDIDSWLLERYKQQRPPMRVVAARRRGRPEDLASLVEGCACDVLIAVTTRETKALEAVPRVR